MANEPLLPFALSPQEFEELTGVAPLNTPGVVKKARPGEIIYDMKGKDTGQRESPDPGLLQAGKGLAAGTGQAFLTTFPSLYGLIGAGVDYATSPKSFSESMFSTEGLERQRQYDQEVLGRIRAANPSFTPEQIQAEFDETRKHSPAYYEKTSENLRTGLSFAHRWNKKINEAVGETRLPTEATGLDTLYNIVGGLWPVPGSTVSRIAATPVGQMVSRIGSTTAGRVALNAAEISTPLIINSPGATKMQQAGRFAANVGLAEGIDQGAKLASGEPTALDYLKDDNGDYDWKRLSALGVGVIGLAASAYKMRHGRVPDIQVQEGMPAQQRLEQNLPNIVGPNRAGLNKLRDDLGAPEAYTRGLGVPEPEVQRMRDTMELNTGAMPGQDFERRWTTGVRSDMSQGTAPNDILRAVMEGERNQPGFAEAFSYFDAIRNRLFDEDRALTAVRQDLHEAQKAYANAMANPNATAQGIMQARQKVRDLQVEMNARINDTDPHLRPSLESMSTADAKAKIAAIRQQFPDIDKIHEKLREEYKADIDIAQREGLFSVKEAANLKQNIDKGLTHFEDHPGAGKTWLQTKMKDIGEKWANEIRGISAQSDFDTYRGLHDRNPRKGYKDRTNNERNYLGRGDPEPRPNQPYDPLSQFAIQTMRTTKAIANNRARRAFFETALNSQANIMGHYVRPADKYYRFPASSLNNPAIKQKIEAWLANKEVPHVGFWKNGEFHVYTIGGQNGRLVRDALNFSPAATIPVLNNLRKLSQQFLTGVFRPAFVAVAVPWDVLSTSLFRNADKYTFGPGSQLAMKFLSPGGNAHRLMTNISAVVDPWIMMSRAIPTMFKRGALAAYADTALQRQVTKLGHSMLQQLQANPNGVMANIAQMPGGQKVLQAVANTMAKGFYNSWYNQMRLYRVGHANNFVGELDTIMKSAEKYGFLKQPGYAQATWERYKAILSAMHDTSKELFFSQNQKRLNSAYNSAIPKAEMDALINAARKTGGDFQRSSGIQWVNAAMSTTRYANVIFQSTKMVAGAIKRDPKGVMAKLALGIVLPKIMMDYQFSNWDQQASDYFWNRPTDSRISTFFVVRPDIAVRRMMGEQIPFDPSYVFEMRMLPEPMPIVSAMVNGLLAMGMLPSNTYKTAPVPLDINRDLGATLDQAFGVTSPAFLGEMFKGAGYDLKPGALFRGDQMVQPLQEPSLMGINKDKMSPGSDIPKAFYDVFTSLFGVATGAYIEGINVMMETNARLNGKDPLAAIKAGAEQVKIRGAASLPFVNNLFPEYSRRFIYTPAAEEVGKFLHGMREGIEKQYQVDLENRPGTARSRAARVSDMDMATAIAQSVDSPLLANLILDVHQTFVQQSSELGKLTTQRADLKAAYDALLRGTSSQEDTQGRTRIVPPRERYAQANRTALQVNALDQARYQLMTQEWQRIVDENGKSFAQQFGTSLTPESLMKAVQVSAQRAYLSVRPPVRVQTQ